ncbi:hypothetical protein [Ruminiclostridium cellobioparum]|uniref:hypothetical protein n=1 Tax=Ruminiclostridium cellobioparum TaxID=29355 RepID=UPI000485ED45|nr:hypothetical protein [Ruminiclostridium cellobioparum]
MKKVKVLLSAFTLTAITSVFLPSICVAEISNEANSLKNAGINQTIDKKAFISPNYNCDPKMLIPGNPDIDPRFLLKQLP